MILPMLRLVGMMCVLINHTMCFILNISNIQGEFQSVSSPAESSLSPSALPDPSASDKMLYIWFTDYVANTAGEVYQKAGAIKYTLTPDKVREKSGITLPMLMINVETANFFCRIKLNLYYFNWYSKTTQCSLYW